MARLVVRAPALLGAFVFRGGCYAAMTALALWNERRPAPSLPDLVVGWLPYVPWVAAINYWTWLALYMPLMLALLWTEPVRWARYMVTAGLVSLLRGVCIVLTGLGPPDPIHAGPGIGSRPFWDAYWELLSPMGVFYRGSMQAYLTKDLFFSGHTATTFLLLLYVWHRPRLRWLGLIAHGIVVATVLFAKLHYSIDIIGGWAVTFVVYALREWQPRPTHAAG